MHCATVFCGRGAERHVQAIRDTNYFFPQFNDRGRIDKKEWEKGMRLGMELLSSVFNEEHLKKVINAHHRFAKRRYEDEFKWKPSRKAEEAIVARGIQIHCD